VIDGGSTDGSQQIIEDYQSELDWWVSEADSGQADAINKGFRRARGEILAWLNSDDLYLPWTIQETAAVFEENPAVEMVYGDAVSADAQGNLLHALRFQQYQLRDLLQFKMICQPAVFFRRSLLERTGLLDESYHFFLDHHLWIRMARETQPVHLPRVLAVSRYHPEAKNVTMATQCGEEVYRILNWAERQPDLGKIIQNNHGSVLSGTHQIHARYLLDGGKPGQALKIYLKAVWACPTAFLRVWHRFLFAALSVLGLGFLGGWYYNLKKLRKPHFKGIEQLSDWPGTT
jgi:glycosyltransferase involved in cell wall biosynthesis